jgi:hypothetical protein
MNGGRYWIALVVGGGLVGAAIQSQAAPVVTNILGIRSAAPSLITDVRHRWRWRPGWSRSPSICWDRGRRVLCAGYPPGN